MEQVLTSPGLTEAPFSNKLVWTGRVLTWLIAIPRTQLLGALLLTAYLGGATATHVRVGDPFWFPIVMGALLWADLYLREPRLRALISK